MIRHRLYHGSVPERMRSLVTYSLLDLSESEDFGAAIAGTAQKVNLFEIALFSNVQAPEQ